MQIQIVNKQEVLEKICVDLMLYNQISIDTEFMRHSTYYAKLSTIQIMNNSYKIVIDVLSKINLFPIKKILQNKKILKIFHAPREDLEIFFYLFNIVPNNLFDTQTAAQICGLGDNLSYSALCKKICNVEINKSYQKANWLKRPIQQEMIEYAIQDVLYLKEIFLFLNKKIEQKKLIDQYKVKIDCLIDKKKYLLKNNMAWTKIRVKSEDLKFIKQIKILAYYREEMAQKLDIPRKHFFSDEDLLSISKYWPSDDKEFDKLHLNSFYLNKLCYRMGIINLKKRILE